jgi:chromate transporter
MSIQAPRPGTWQLFGIWTRIGLQSFGGGASTTFLIQRAFIEQQRWLSMEEFLHLWNLCLLTPGINLVSLTVLLGKKMGGYRGIAASLAGLLLPSATITCLLAALFLHIEQEAAVQTVLQGVTQATGGMMVLVALNFARPLLQKGYKAGWFSLLANSAIVIASALAIIVLKVSVIVVVLGAACLGVIFFSAQPTTPEQEAQEEQP